ncbi:hypothetical protein MLD38_029743 [Melastoma candidum]|uniref:Uncharacterized protein n=1 Tax=Melastoma candidum TaxID=119954 RepID=A0ACB9NA89_9MYRT|nr:hypothetical protein MLD38_029743 [Melastoma candidum]
MASFRGISVVLASIVVAILVVRSTAEPDVSVIASACDGKQVSLVSDYAHARSKALDDAVAKTPTNTFDFRGKGSYNSAESYSHGKCNGKIDRADCWTCMRIAETNILRYCTTNAEGWVQLKDCYVGFWEFKN